MGNVKCTNVGSLLLNHISDTTQLTVVERNQPVKKMIEKMKSCELPNMKFNRTSVDLDFKYYYPSVEYLLDYMDKNCVDKTTNEKRCQELKDFIQKEANWDNPVSCREVGSLILAGFANWHLSIGILEDSLYRMKSCENTYMNFKSNSVPDMDVNYYYKSVANLLDYMDKKLYICIYNKERCQDLKEFIQGEADRSSSVSCSDVGSVLLKAPSTDEPTYQYMYLMKK